MTEVQAEHSVRLLPDNFAETKGNFILHSKLTNTLRRITSDITNLKVLDYGAGANPAQVSLFNSLSRNQETTAYEPNLQEKTYREKTKFSNPILWTNEEPSGAFDLTICSFSIHHMEQDPADIVRRLKKYNPKFVAIYEYDFTNTSFEEFKNEFVSELEQKELIQSFNGDWEKCYQFHKKKGKLMYRDALESNGYTILNETSGEEVAKDKFFMIAVPKAA